MCNRSNSLLRIRIILALFIAGFLIVPELLSIAPTDTAIIEVKAQVDAMRLAAQYALTVLDSIPELHKYLVRGDAANHKC